MKKDIGKNEFFCRRVIDQYVAKGGEKASWVAFRLVNDEEYLSVDRSYNRSDEDILEFQEELYKSKKRSSEYAGFAVITQNFLKSEKIQYCHKPTDLNEYHSAIFSKLEDEQNRISLMYKMAKECKLIKKKNG